eukprot:scaffold1002_cov117-Isochrysis_galbana.AAC.10
MGVVLQGKGTSTPPSSGGSHPSRAPTAKRALAGATQNRKQRRFQAAFAQPLTPSTAGGGG